MNIARAQLVRTETEVIEETTKERRLIDFIDKKYLGKIYYIDLDSLVITYAVNIDLGITYFVPCVMCYENGVATGKICYGLLEVLERNGVSN